MDIKIRTKENLPGEKAVINMESSKVELIKEPKSLDRCLFCSSSSNNPYRYGHMYKYENITVHYFCILMSSHLKQKGKDEDGIFGFLPVDIYSELERAKSVKCYICDRVGATSQCNFKERGGRGKFSRCNRAFHLPCGITRGSLHWFFGRFQSMCHIHRKSQKIPPEYLAEEATECRICQETISDVFSGGNTLWAPCCKKNYFHKDCVQKAAFTYGDYHFKCPMCNDQNEFKRAMLQCGIFIPIQDAEWEREPNAFSDLYAEHNHCDIEICICPHSKANVDKRDYSSGSWDIIRCSSCGSQGTHRPCSKLSLKGKIVWNCRFCQEILNQKFNEEEQEESNYSYEDETCAAFVCVAKQGRTYKMDKGRFAVKYCNDCEYSWIHAHCKNLEIGPEKANATWICKSCINSSEDEEEEETAETSTSATSSARNRNNASASKENKSKTKKRIVDRGKIDSPKRPPSNIISSPSTSQATKIKRSSVSNSQSTLSKLENKVQTKKTTPVSTNPLDVNIDKTSKKIGRPKRNVNKNSSSKSTFSNTETTASSSKSSVNLQNNESRSSNVAPVYEDAFLMKEIFRIYTSVPQEKHLQSLQELCKTENISPDARQFLEEKIKAYIAEEEKQKKNDVIPSDDDAVPTKRPRLEETSSEPPSDQQTENDSSQVKDTTIQENLVSSSETLASPNKELAAEKKDEEDLVVVSDDDGDVMVLDSEEEEPMHENDSEDDDLEVFEVRKSWKINGFRNCTIPLVEIISGTPAPKTIFGEPKCDKYDLFAIYNKTDDKTPDVKEDQSKEESPGNKDASEDKDTQVPKTSSESPSNEGDNSKPSPLSADNIESSSSTTSTSVSSVTPSTSFPLNVDSPPVTSSPPIQTATSLSSNSISDTTNLSGMQTNISTVTPPINTKPQIVSNGKPVDTFPTMLSSLKTTPPVISTLPPKEPTQPTLIQFNPPNLTAPLIEPLKDCRTPNILLPSTVPKIDPMQLSVPRPEPQKSTVSPLIPPKQATVPKIEPMQLSVPRPEPQKSTVSPLKVPKQATVPKIDPMQLSVPRPEPQKSTMSPLIPPKQATVPMMEVVTLDDDDDDDLICLD